MIANLIRTRNNEANPVRALRSEMDSLFEDFFRGFDIEPVRFAKANFMPSINISEDEKVVEISAELPGMDMKDVEVTFNDNVLTIRGEKKTQHEEKTRNYHRVERTYGTFERSIPVRIEIEQDKIAANFKNGVLTVTLPKSTKAQVTAKRIEVKNA